MPAQNPGLNEQNREEEEQQGTRERSYSPSHQNGDSCNNTQSRHLSPSPSQSPHPQASHERSRGGEDDGKKEEEVEVKEGVEEEDDGDEKEEEDDDDEEFEKEEKQEGSNESESSSSEDELPEFVLVDIREIRKDVQCPICLGIIKKTRTVMECLHRFCRECIDKSMRMGNNECPTCRTHCASRRSLRDDPNFDALIAALYPDIDKYEEEELAFQEEERARNKQIQASIAQVLQRQSETLVRRRTIGKETSAFTTRTQRDSQTRHPKRRRISRGNDFQGSEYNEEEKNDNGVKDSSSADEHSMELQPGKRKRQSGSRSLQPSSSGTNENDSEVSRDNRGMLVWNKEMFAWGRGGARSHTRHGNASNGNNKNSRSTRISKLLDYLRSSDNKNDGLDIHLKLISLDSGKTPSLQRPYICCKPSLSIKHLSQYIAQQTQLQNEEIEIMLVKDEGKHGKNLSTLHPPVPLDELQVLKGEETLAGLITRCIPSRDGLILAYQRKKTNS